MMVSPPSHANGGIQRQLYAQYGKTDLTCAEAIRIIQNTSVPKRVARDVVTSVVIIWFLKMKYGSDITLAQNTL